MKLVKIGVISSIILIVIGVILFFSGAGVKNFSIMWAGVIVFCIGVALLIACCFIRMAIKERIKRAENMKRG